MLQNAYFLAKIGADTAENEQLFAENLPKIGNYPTGPLRLGTKYRGGVDVARAALSAGSRAAARVRKRTRSLRSGMPS